MTFAERIGELALVPSAGGVFRVLLDGDEIFNKKAAGEFPESKTLKQLIRDRIDPEMSLGHSDS